MLDMDSSGLIASILRFQTFRNTDSFTDSTYHAVELVIWTIAEPGIYLISACMLVYRPVLRDYILGTFGIEAR